MPWSLVNQPICDAIVIPLNSFHKICEQVIDSLAALATFDGRPLFNWHPVHSTPVRNCRVVLEAVRLAARAP